MCFSAEMTIQRPTKEAQDQWFRANGIDPWGYHTRYVQKRLDRSLRFVRHIVGEDFGGVFVEVGAFNGEFTRRLAGAYPQNHLVAADLVKAAWEAAEKKEPFASTVSFQWCDMMDFQMPAHLSDRPTVLLLMECLYYLPKADRAVAVQHLLNQCPEANMVFISGPLDEQSYFAGKDVIDLFKAHDFGLVSARSVMPTRLGQAFLSLYCRLRGRKLPVRQVMYCFKR